MDDSDLLLRIQQDLATLGSHGSFGKLQAAAAACAQALRVAYDLGPGNGMTQQEYAAVGVKLALFDAAAMNLGA